MATFTRKNAWINDGTFNNPDLLWYAKAVQEMQSRPISDPTSWWAYAAIHAELLLPASVIPPPPAPPYPPDLRYLNWINIKYIPSSAKLNKLPSTKLIDLFWGQCQHGTWFFPPWHRGYLVAIENILRDIIITQLKGPGDWALPYWNYLNQSAADAQSNIPPAFTIQQLPDGTANPLYVLERYGKVKLGNSETENTANDECQWDTLYNDGSTRFPSGRGNNTGYLYGGGGTGFEPSGSEKGDLEDNPHNAVHSLIGGNRNNDENDHMGLMGVTNTAALDPIFYLHHANIDRMWAAWNETGKNKNSPDPNWLKGPTAQGDRHFVMPLDPKGTPWYYTPEDVQNTTNLKYNGFAYSYVYDDLSLTSYNTTPPAQFIMNLSERFDKLGIKQRGKNIKMANKINTELVGASTGQITLKGSETYASVKLNKTSWKSVSNSLLEASFSTKPDEVYLELEGVKGGSETNFLSIYVNEKFVKSVSLFGLLNASLKNSAHGGGLNFKFNITNIVDDMHLEGNIDVDSLNIQIKTKRPLPDQGGITIDRIGVYRAGQ